MSARRQNNRAFPLRDVDGPERVGRQQTRSQRLVQFRGVHPPLELVPDFDHGRAGADRRRLGGRADARLARAALLERRRR